jgi:hypothetical protein
MIGASSAQTAIDPLKSTTSIGFNGSELGYKAVAVKVLSWFMVLFLCLSQVMSD